LVLEWFRKGKVNFNARYRIILEVGLVGLLVECSGYFKDALPQQNSAVYFRRLSAGGYTDKKAFCPEHLSGFCGGKEKAAAG